MGGFDFYPLRSHPGVSIVRGERFEAGKASTFKHSRTLVNGGASNNTRSDAFEYRKSEAKRARRLIRKIIVRSIFSLII